MLGSLGDLHGGDKASFDGILGEIADLPSYHEQMVMFITISFI